MRKEAVLIVGGIVAILGLFGVLVTPEQNEAIEAILVVIIPIIGAYFARNNVASKNSVRNELGVSAERKVFGK